MSERRPSGVIAAVATPLGQDGQVDQHRLIEHCRWLLDNGCDGINLLGTTGEATSMALDQRLEVMNSIANSDLPVKTFLVGTGAAAVPDAVRLTAAARELGFGGALLLPPFYYKGLDDDDVASFVEQVIRAVNPTGLRLYLYNFPQMTGITYSVDVVTRLYTAHPDTLAGLKDSSGDLEYAANLARRNPGLDVFPSSEATLHRQQELASAGCISATLNVTAPLVGEAIRLGIDGAGTEVLQRAIAIRQALSTVPLVPAVKWALGEMYGAPVWRRVLCPLRAIEGSHETRLREALSSTDFGQSSHVPIGAAVS